MQSFVAIVSSISMLMQSDVFFFSSKKQACALPVVAWQVHQGSNNKYVVHILKLGASKIFGMFIHPRG